MSQADQLWLKSALSLNAGAVNVKLSFVPLFCVVVKTFKFVFGSRVVAFPAFV